MAIKLSEGLNGLEFINFVLITCAECGVQFLVSEQYRERLRETGKGFYCPSGHLLSYKKTGCEKKIDEVEKKLKQSEVWVEHLNEETKNLWRDINELKKKNLELRSTKCPHCHNLYINIKRHILKNHPNK